jgi:hypothetical protein
MEEIRVCSPQPTRFTDVNVLQRPKEEIDISIEEIKVCSSQPTRFTDVNVLQRPKSPEKEEIVSIEDLSPIAQPLAQRKLLKRLYRIVKKGAGVSLSCDST